MKKIEHYLNQPEGQTYDKKSGRIDPKALAVTMVAMANADGGTIAVGIEDDGTISGIDGMAEPIFRQDGFMLRERLSAISASLNDPNVPNLVQMDLSGQILSLIRERPSVSRRELSERLAN